MNCFKDFIRILNPISNRLFQNFRWSKWLMYTYTYALWRHQYFDVECIQIRLTVVAALKLRRRSKGVLNILETLRTMHLMTAEMNFVETCCQLTQSKQYGGKEYVKWKVISEWLWRLNSIFSTVLWNKIKEKCNLRL